MTKVEVRSGRNLEVLHGYFHAEENPKGMSFILPYQKNNRMYQISIPLRSYVFSRKVKKVMHVNSKILKILKLLGFLHD